jgi:hypothetical protein
MSPDSLPSPHSATSTQGGWIKSCIPVQVPTCSRGCALDGSKFASLSKSKRAYEKPTTLLA